MSRLLTIAIPTFNRAELLDKQLEWLSQAILGFENDCEILISDNCSTDNTQDIIKKWQNKLSNIIFISNRNTSNIGVMRNIMFCLNTAQSKYVWTIGDDDPIKNNTLSYIIDNLKKHPELSLLVLNYSRFNAISSQIIKERNFNITEEKIHDDARTFIEHNIKEGIFGFGFMTAQVYRTDTVKMALKKWQNSLNNLEMQVFWGAYCALQGSIKFSHDVFVEYTCGTNCLSDKKTWFKVYYADLVRVYTKLKEIGYSPEFCQKLIIRHFTHQHTLRILLGAIRRYPILGLKTAIPYLFVVLSNTFQLMLTRRQFS
ncbi:family 2 glycosyl transferase [Calothrix sp. NIES-4101]|nr:family 2 glycosyl transferase [Calothrix sp. NIES-4101]